jgi:MraZ protein
MLIGGSKHTIDAKGRMFFPVRFKEDFPGVIIACRGAGRYLMLFSPEGWEEFFKNLKGENANEDMQLKRYFFASAAECAVDGQGRLLIPQELREHAGLEKNIRVVGTDNRVEIWDEEEWTRSQLSNDEVVAIMSKIRF